MEKRDKEFGSKLAHRSFDLRHNTANLRKLNDFGETPVFFASNAAKATYGLQNETNKVIIWNELEAVTKQNI
jgi:hypothetical protein